MPTSVACSAVDAPAVVLHAVTVPCVWYRVLGPIDIVTDDDRVVSPSRRYERAVLGVLLLADGIPVAEDRLVELLWGDEPPPTARPTLRGYVARIRQVLRDAGSRAVLAAGRGGYLLDVPVESVDAHRFRVLVGQARTADPVERERLLTQARELWRGPLLPDLPPGPRRDRLTAGLEQARLNAIEDLVAVRLDLGRVDDVLADLAVLTADHPERERLVALEILALNRAGRSADALTTYERASAYFTNPLGLEPGTGLREPPTLMMPGVLPPSVGLLGVGLVNPAFRRASELLSGVLAERVDPADRDETIDLFRSVLTGGRSSVWDELDRMVLALLLMLRAADAGSPEEAERDRRLVQRIADEAAGGSSVPALVRELNKIQDDRDALRAVLAQVSRAVYAQQSNMTQSTGPLGGSGGAGRANVVMGRSAGSSRPLDEDERTTWLTEDEDVWGADAHAPNVLGTPDPPGIDRPPLAEPDRYLVGELPSRIRAGAELSLIVSITTSPMPGQLAAALLGFTSDPEGTPVTLIAQPDAGLQSLDELQQTVRVPWRGDSPPVRFAFRARAVGLSRIRVTAWLGGTFLAELRVEVSVEAEVPAGDSQRRTAAIGTLHGEPGEVTLQVHFDGARYSFQLLSQSYLSGPVVAESLTEEPGAAVERTVAMLRRMAGDTSGYPPALAARWIRETGTGLWRDLVPRSIQDQFWDLRDSISSFTIACDQDTVPWELLYPLTPTDDAGFLVEQFPVLRRVYDQRRAHRVRLANGRYVIPPGSPANAQHEVAAIRRVLGQPGDATIADLAELLDLLDSGGVGLLHFACHNTFSLETGGSSIKMAGGPFVPQLLNSAVARRRLAAASPLIFVNACRSAGVAPAYTRMMGWAEQFMAAGAGAFVGTLWPVRSSRASQFAEAFYDALAGWQDLGGASLAARRAAKDDGDPTWLAYTVYGDPTATGTLD
jgi:DNA-binding SARP family transcriptional activator